MGGVHPTLLPDEALKHADTVMIGFSEYTFPEMLLDFRAKAEKALCPERRLLS